MKRLLSTLLFPALVLAGCGKYGYPTASPPLPVPDSSALNGITSGGIPPAGTTTYVGAFWRADQTGERVIRINTGTDAANTGAWSATVAWYDPQWDPAHGDGAVLAAGGSADPKIYTATPGDAEKYKVSGTAAIISGTAIAGGDIIFRIGLTKKFTAYSEVTDPARYAVVVLTYGTPAKTQKLFLRQGEGPDYVMAPGDPDGSNAAVGGADNRSFAKKFSPCNLTDPHKNTSTDFNAMTTPATGLAGVRGGRFVDYPTQAGYFFQWNYSSRAFQPTTPAGAFTNWNSSNYNPGFWNAAADETCPPGYRRPQDGNPSAYNTDEAVAGSEMRQSLWLNPQDNGTSNLDNSAWGYYADGYFDRRQIVTSVDGHGNSAVASPGTKAAYIGRLFFNPSAASGNYNASLFFPAAGSRYYSDGTLHFVGDGGGYLSSTLSPEYREWYPGLRAWYLSFNFEIARQFCSSVTYGFSVRCVRE